MIVMTRSSCIYYSSIEYTMLNTGQVPGQGGLQLGAGRFGNQLQNDVLGANALAAQQVANLRAGV